MTETYAEASKQTLAEFLERWLATVKPNLEAKTFERYKEIVDLNINPRLGVIQLTKLQPLQLSNSTLGPLLPGTDAQRPPQPAHCFAYSSLAPQGLTAGSHLASSAHKSRRHDPSSSRER